MGLVMGFWRIRGSDAEVGCVGWFLWFPRLGFSSRATM